MAFFRKTNHTRTATWLASILLLAALAMSLLLPMSACTDSKDNEWAEVPVELQQFISKYFPGQTVEKFGEKDGTFYVDLYNSAALIFSSDYQWKSVNGCGEPLPEMFLFDQLPPDLYEYLSETTSLTSIYSVARTSAEYTVDLLNSSLQYTISTGAIHSLP